MQNVKLDAIRAKIKRWQSRATRAQNMLVKLYRQESRAIKAAQRPEPASLKAPAPAPAPAPTAASDDCGIPDFLQRKKDGEMRDKIAADAIRAEQDERKRNKARVRIDTMKAKQSGASKRMPLQGKDALRAIYD